MTYLYSKVKVNRRKEKNLPEAAKLLRTVYGNLK
jgi:hypothetical protein